MYSLFYSRNKYAFMFSITPFCSSADNSSNEKHMWIIFLLTVTDNNCDWQYRQIAPYSLKDPKLQKPTLKQLQQNAEKQK